MQNTLPITPGNPLRNITGLARQIALPGEHAPLRFPSFPSLDRTAVIGFNQPTTLDLPAAASVGVMQFRQAVYPTWAEVSNQHYFTVVDARLDRVGSRAIAADAAVIFNPAPAYIGATADGRARTGTLPGVGALGTYLKYPLIGADRGCPGLEFAYVPNGGDVNVVVTCDVSVTADVLCVVSLDRWMSPGESAEQFQIAVTVPNLNRGGIGGTAISSLLGGWYRVRSCSMICSGTTPASENWTVSLCCSTAGATYVPQISDRGTVSFLTYAPGERHMLPIVAATEFQSSPIPWYATRVTASALLGTNVSQVLNKGGTILGGRFSPAQQNAWQASYAQIANLHPAEKAYLPLESGVYTYCPPSTDLVFFHDYTLNTGGGAPDAPLFRLDNDSLYNKMYITATAVAETLACTSSWHLEFRTNSALFQIGMCGMTMEALHSAQLVLAETGFFFENPEHDGMLETVIRTAKKYVPQSVGIVNPAAGKMLQSLVSKMSNSQTVKPRNGPSKPPATSAESSGMTKKPKAKQGKAKPGKGKKGKK